MERYWTKIVTTLLKQELQKSLIIKFISTCIHLKPETCLISISNYNYTVFESVNAFRFDIVLDSYISEEPLRKITNFLKALN